MTKANRIAVMTTRLFLVSALAIGATNIVLVGQIGHCKSGRRSSTNAAAMAIGKEIQSSAQAGMAEH